MNFRDFVNRDETPKRRVQPEPVEEVYNSFPESEDDYECEDDEVEEYYEEPSRQVQRIVHQPQRVQSRPQPKPQPRPVQRTQSVYRSQPQRIQRQAMPVDQYNRPIQISKKQLAENTIENTANTLTEAIKRKVDTIFYRFGIQGLEKLDEKILDTIEELQYPEPKPIKKSGVNMRRVPGKRVVRKPKPLPIQEIEQPVYEEPIDEIYEEQLPPEPIYEEVQEPVEEVVEQPIDDVDVVEEESTPVVEEKKEPNILEMANQLLDIDPSQELVHEANGSNPVFDTVPNIPMGVTETSTQTPKEPQFEFEVPPIETPKLVTMPSLDEAMNQMKPGDLPEVPNEAPVKKTRKKKEKDTQTNEEK